MLITSYIFEPVGGALVLLTLPLVVELAVLTVASRLPKRRLKNSPSGAPVHLSVIIPAHNEEVLIASCIQSIRVSAAGSSTRIVAVAHNCTDRTAERAAEAGAEVVRYNSEAKGKGCALAFGFDYAISRGADAVLVVDADSTVSGNLVGAVREAIANGAEAVQCRYEMESSSKRPTTRLIALAFRGFNLIRPAGRDRLSLSAGILGNGFAVRQTLLAQNSYNSLSVVEDLEFHIKLVLAGKRVHFLDQARVSSGMPSSKEGEETQRSRWEGGRAHAAAAWLPQLLMQVARGRLRRLEPVIDLASLPIGYASFLLFLAACLPLAWLRIYVLVAAGVLAGHVLAAAWSGPDFAADMRILARAPGYIVWKLFMLPNLLRSSRADAAWVPTERQPALPKATLEAVDESMAANAMKHELQVSGSMEIS